MDVLQEMTSNLTGTSRAILISEKDVDLRPRSPDNRLFLLKIGEGSLAAGGRGGGFGERKVIAVFCFQSRDGDWSKLFEASPEQTDAFEIPYYVSRLPLTMNDGTEAMGYGVVEPDLVGEFSKKAGLSSSA